MNYCVHLLQDQTEKKLPNYRILAEFFNIAAHTLSVKQSIKLMISSEMTWLSFTMGSKRRTPSIANQDFSDIPWRSLQSALLCLIGGSHIDRQMSHGAKTRDIVRDRAISGGKPKRSQLTSPISHGVDGNRGIRRVFTMLSLFGFGDDILPLAHRETSYKSWTLFNFLSVFVRCRRLNLCWSAVTRLPVFILNFVLKCGIHLWWR